MAPSSVVIQVEFHQSIKVFGIRKPESLCIDHGRFWKVVVEQQSCPR